MVVIIETRISGDRAVRISQDFGFTNFAIADSVGFSGGLWLLWNEDEIHCDILDVTTQEIHACVQIFPNSSPWIFSAIYGRPNYAIRRELWKTLQEFADSHNPP